MLPGALLLRTLRSPAIRHRTVHPVFLRFPYVTSLKEQECSKHPFHDLYVPIVITPKWKGYIFKLLFSDSFRWYADTFNGTQTNPLASWLFALPNLTLYMADQTEQSYTTHGWVGRSVVQWSVAQLAISRVRVGQAPTSSIGYWGSVAFNWAFPGLGQVSANAKLIHGLVEFFCVWYWLSWPCTVMPRTILQCAVCCVPEKN
jgi:hypothetical protein